jgi:hypothetical protein
MISSLRERPFAIAARVSWFILVLEWLFSRYQRLCDRAGKMWIGETLRPEADAWHWDSDVKL